MYNTLETSGENVEPTRNEWGRCRTHSKRVKIMLEKILLEVLAPRRYQSDHGPPVSIEIVKEKKTKIESNYSSVLLETYSRSRLVRSHENLKSYWTSTELWKLSAVFDYCEAIGPFSRIGLLRSYVNFNSYCAKIIETSSGSEVVRSYEGCVFVSSQSRL